MTTPASVQTVDHLVDFDPTRIEERTYATRGRRYLLDVTALINLLLITLFLIPAELVIPQLTAVGRPALVLGLLMAGLWMMSRLHPELVMRGRQPIRWALALWLLALLASYAAGQLRGLTLLETNGADRAMIYALVFIGAALACADGIPNRRRLDDVLRVMVWSAAAVAMIGILQSMLGFEVLDYVSVPGLELHTVSATLEDRSGFNRIAGTTAHYIEFSALMALVLPFAIHLAWFGRAPLVRQLAVVSGVIIAAGIPLSLSRTGLLGLLVVAVIMLPAWTWRVRLNVVTVMAALIGATMVVRPGLLGTLRGLFTNWDSDASVQGRVERYPVVMEFFSERPWFGRGTGTFIPELYLILDNQWLAELVQTGIVGVAALLGLQITAVYLAMRVRRHTTSPEDRHLASCLIAAQVLAIVCAGTFDSFAFTTFTTTIAICTGLAGALWRLTHPVRPIRTDRARRWPVHLAMPPRRSASGPA